jgi:hypothetical protein
MRGACLCGDIAFEVRNPPQSGSACHCIQCRKLSGNYWTSAHVIDEDLSIEGSPRWYRSSEKARRGFCGTCGAFLFWKHDDEDHTSFSLGALDPPTGVKVTRHIFTEFKGDYYDLIDDLPKS